MHIQIPGCGALDLEHVVLDFNGTLAVDGVVNSEVRELLRRLAESFTLHVLTADTRGTAAGEVEDLPVTLHIVTADDAGGEKRRIVEHLGATSCACLGNGRNDAPMLGIACLAIAVLEKEGMYAGLISEADLIVRSIEDGLNLLLDEKRLIAGLRG